MKYEYINYAGMNNYADEWCVFFFRVHRELDKEYDETIQKHLKLARSSLLETRTTVFTIH